MGMSLNKKNVVIRDLAWHIISVILVGLIQVEAALAKDSKPGTPPLNPISEPPSLSSSTEGEQVNVDAIKEKYWARGNETELGVVQNRTYSKIGRFEFGVLGGVVQSDPFLSTKILGLELGYHLNEYLAVQILGFQYYASPSAALETFQKELDATTNTNYPKSYLGTEVAGSVLYGKLSVLGKSIIYYDLHLLGGIGMTNTETGAYVTPSVGIGQRFYATQHFSLRVDYRMQYFRETILEKQIITQLGQSRGSRDNWSNVITIGFYYMF